MPVSLQAMSKVARSLSCLSLLLAGACTLQGAETAGSTTASSTAPAIIPGTDLLLQAANSDFWDSGRIVDLSLTYGLPALGALLTLFIAYIVSAWASRAIGNALRRAKVDETLALFFAKALRWLILICAFIAILGNFGISTASFAAVLAAVGFGIGLAMEGTLSNVAAGVMLLVFRPFKVGDFISVSGESGGVSEIDLFTTTMNTLDNRRIIMPNKLVFGQTMINFSANDLRRVDVMVGVAYAADIDQTRAVLTEALEAIESYQSENAPEAYLMELGSSSVDWQCRVWTAPKHYWEVRQAVTEGVKKHLDAAGITIAFPQLDVHLGRQ